MFTKMDETNIDKWKKHFDDLANKFGQSIKANDYFDVRHFRVMQEIVSRIIKETQANLIVDVGCGNGVFSEMAATERTVYGIDISSAMLKYAVQKGLKCIQSNALELPLRSDSSDITLFIGVLQLFKHGEEIDRCLSELHRITKPNGLIILSTLNGESLLRKVFCAIYDDAVGLHFERMFRIEELIRMLKRVNIEITVFYSLYPPLPWYTKHDSPGIAERLLASTVVIVGKKKE